MQALVNAQNKEKEQRFDHLKYIVLNVNNSILSNMLGFLGYWDTYGYSKPTRFASSLRMELMVKVDSDLQERFYVQFIYDDEIVKFPWCTNSKGRECLLDDFIEYAVQNVILDYDYVDKFCKGDAGTNYIKMPKPKRDYSRP